MDKLYLGEERLEVLIKDSISSDWWNVYFTGNDGEPDCQVGHFGKNIFFRTEKGIGRERYETFSELMLDIVKTCKKELGFEVINCKII